MYFLLLSCDRDIYDSIDHDEVTDIVCVLLTFCWFIFSLAHKEDVDGELGEIQSFLNFHSTSFWGSSLD